MRFQLYFYPYPFHPLSFMLKFITKLKSVLKMFTKQYCIKGFHVLIVNNPLSILNHLNNNNKKSAG